MDPSIPILPHLELQLPLVPLEESLALPPEFDSFCVRHSPANEQVINEEFPGGSLRSGLTRANHQDLLVKRGLGCFLRVGTGWSWGSYLKVWRWPLIFLLFYLKSCIGKRRCWAKLQTRKTISGCHGFWLRAKLFELDAHLESNRGFCKVLATFTIMVWHLRPQLSHTMMAHGSVLAPQNAC